MVKPSILQESSPESHPSGEVGSVVESEGVWHSAEAASAQPAPPTNSDIPGSAVPESVLDVALGLVLNEIAHQARSITNATGSAVLLVRKGVPVCRSISGATARDVSTYLNECSVCADLSWRDGSSQNCHDVETDSRFDPTSCRRLGLRSFASVPIQDDNKAVVAIVQTFSSRPEAFSDRDILALRGLGSHIVGHTEAASRNFRSIPNFGERVTRDTTPAEKPYSRFRQQFHLSKFAIFHERVNLGLGMAIIFLALLLGWTIGRSEREAAHQSKDASLAPVVDRPQDAVLPAKPNSSGSIQSTNQTIASDVPSVSVPEVEHKISQTPNQESKKHHVKQRRSLVSTPAHSDTGGLVIFESGTQVFPTNSLHSGTPSDPDSKDESRSGRPKSSDQGTPVTISEDVAEQQLLRRVEPDYPEYAREQRLQGKVVLNVRVGKDGTVRSLSRVGGDPQLAILAAKAVQQWKFAPLVREDRPVSFESQVTLSFELP